MLLIEYIYRQFFHEIYIKADLATCEKRDPKGLYKKARRGEIPEFTGISSPYEQPESPELIIDTNVHDMDVCVEMLIEYIQKTISLQSLRETYKGNIPF